MTERMKGFVLVGIDPGWRSDDVVRAAAQEAHRRGTDLVIVAIVRRSQEPRHSAKGLRADDAWAESTALRALTEARDRLDAVEPPATVQLWEDEVTPDRFPISDAALLVLGSRGRHGRLAFGATSPSRALLKAVQCPVLTVPCGTAPATTALPRPVVAGIGDHPRDRAVLEIALAEAARLGTDLQIVHAYAARFDETLSRGMHRAGELVTSMTEGLDPGQGTVMAALLTQHTPAVALLSQARTAALLVIGTRPGALSGLVLDSVSHAVLEATPCPVLIVQRGDPRPPRTEQPATAAAAEVQA